jgi:predicted DNA-binding transcriptional regulator AlpA
MAKKLEPHISSPKAAAMIGVKPKTLAQWRWQGRGPRGAIRISKRLVVYPESEILAFIEEHKAEGQGVVR